MDYGNSVTVLRKYADMLDAQNTVQEAEEVELVFVEIWLEELY